MGARQPPCRRKGPRRGGWCLQSDTATGYRRACCQQSDRVQYDASSHIARRKAVLVSGRQGAGLLVPQSGVRSSQT
jgi:hypothetical protein